MIESCVHAETVTQMRVDVAVLEERYNHIDEQLVDGKAAMTVMNGKLDTVIAQLIASQAKKSMMAKVWMVGRHAATLVVAVAAAKIFHEPINFGS